MQDIAPPPKPKAKPDSENKNPASKPVESKLTTNTDASTTTSEPILGGKVKPAWYRRLLTALLMSLTILALLGLNISIWANRTLINQKGFETTFSPLADNAKVQSELANKLTDKIIDSATPQELAAKVLPAADLTSNDQTLKKQLQPVIKTALLKAMKNPHFGTAWRNALNSAHQVLIDDTNNNGAATVNLRPVLNDVLDSLQGTDLSFIAEQHRNEVLKGDTGVIKFENKNLTQVHQAVALLRLAPLLLGVTSLVLFALTVVASPYRFKTARKISLITSLFYLLTVLGLLAGRLAISSFAPPEVRDAANGALPQILGGLVQQSIIAGTLGILVWFSMYILHRTKLSRIS